MLTDVPSAGRNNVKVLFLGQCLQYEYKDVDRASTYVTLASSGLAARFPQVSLQLDRKHLYHPYGLRAILRHRLRFARPDIAVISVVGTFAANPTRVNLLYEIAPELVDTIRSFAQKVEAGRSPGPVEAKTRLDGLMSWHPPLGLDEYERLVREGVEICQAKGTRVVLLGPGRFNEDTTETYAIASPELWSSVNDMVGRVSRSMGVAAVDVFGRMHELGGEVFLPNNIRWSRLGHQVVARELEHVLAGEVAALVGSTPLVANATAT